MEPLFLLALALTTTVAVGNTPHRPMTIYGCQYNPSICSKYEVCVEDNLFGTCQNLLSESRILQFRASDELKKVLEFSLKSLLKLGYGWGDPYTQCIIGGLLESYELYTDPDLTACDRVEKARLASQYYTNSKLNTGNKQTSYHDNMNVYNSRPATTDTPFYLLKDTTTLSNEDFLSKLSLSDLRALEKYLSLTLSIPSVQNGGTTAKTITTAGSEAKRGLSEVDYWLLEQLTSGLITVDDLSTSQIKRLKTYLQSVLYKTGSTVGKTPTVSEQESTTPGVSEQERTTPTVSAHEDTTKIEGQVKSAEELKKEAEIIDILQMFTAESMSNGRDRPDKTPGGNILGQTISDHMKQIQDTEVQGEVDKKSGTGIVKVSSKAPEVRGLSAAASLDVIDTSYVYINVDRTMTLQAALDLVLYIADELDINRVMLGDVGVEGKHITFQVGSGSTYNSTQLATSIQEDLADKIKDKYGVHVLSTGIGHSKNELQISPVGKVLSPSDSTTIAVVVTVTVILCVVVIMLITWRCMYSKWHHSLGKFDSLSTTIKGESTQDSYEDLCRQRMQTTNDGSAAPAPSDSELDRVSPLKSKSDMSGAHAERLRSPRSSTSSWSEEPVNLAMDISTGHTILNYMESHLKNSKKLDEEWTALESYVPDRCDVESGKLHPSKNRYPTILPYDHNRVKLGHIDENNDDYINASFVADHDRRSPAYVVTQGPLQSTVGQFWQMVWEQDCTSIVMLTSLAEENKTVCYQYWPSDGREVYGKNFEVMLVSEHSWCETYLVRNMYLKNLSTNQTRTVTQFHFLSWPISSVPEDCKDFLDFRRKVNKSYRGKTSPTLVCCSDGSGRSGTYVLLDNIINRIHKGVKEIDIAASLEHIRDQRMGSVETKVQFEFTLSAIAEEVQALLQALH